MTEPPRRSGRISLWAAASFVCSLALCPPMCLIAIVFGVVGLGQIRRHPEMYGRRLAWAGIGIGTIVAMACVVGGFWWHVNVRTPMLEGPADAIRAGMAGDIDAFRAGFLPDAATTDEDAARFCAQLHRRYGALVAMRPDDQTDADAPVGFTNGRADIPYQIRFEQGAVTGVARFVLFDDGKPPPVCTWAWIRIVDADEGDLTYPVSAPPLGTEPDGTVPAGG
ncbi:MAG: DUF4190 domain-containing protein [Planctomycetota bacterium]|jgi:hypothetical protein